MKRLVFFLIFVLFVANAQQVTTTPNIGLEIPLGGTPNWNIPLNYNFNLLDQLIGGTQQNPGVGLSLKPLFGTGAPAVPCTVNNQGQQYFDTSTSPFTGYVCNGLVWSPSGSSGGGSFPSNALVYGLTSSTSRAATPSDFAALLSSLVGCATASYVYSPANGNCISTSGPGGSGTVSSSGPYNDTGYQAGTAGTVVTGISNKFTMPTGLSAAALQTQFSRISSSTINLQNGDFSHFNSWTNNSNTVNDDRGDIPTVGWNVKESDAQCDATTFNGNVTHGSPTLTWTNGSTVDGQNFTPADAGDPTTHLGAKWISMVGVSLDTGHVTRWDAQVIGYTDVFHVTLDSNAPFTESNWSFTFGHIDTAAMNSAMTLWRGAAMTIKIPARGVCWSHALKLEGQSLEGQGSNVSFLLPFAGEDTIAADDPTNGSFIGNSNPGQTIKHLGILVDARIDSTLPWDTDISGTVTAKTPTYRPWGILTYLANNPLGWGWIQNAQNGVASVTNGSAVMCVPSGSSGTIPLPPTTQPIFFPYQATNTAIFKTTVASYSGSCPTGSSPVTLGTAYTGPTNSQAEWFTGTAVQTLQTAIPATGRTFPMTVNVSLPINPTPLNTVYAAPPQFGGANDTFDSNVAPYGTILIDGEQCSYFGTSSYPANTSTTYSFNLTACAQNGTSAASHSTGAYMAPLNPYNPSWPWPVFNGSTGSSPYSSQNGATSTPATAEYFPAASSGNAGLSFANYNGAFWNGNESFLEATVDDVIFTNYPTQVFSSENATSYGTQNSSTCMYIVALPFNSHFHNVKCNNLQDGIMEGQPAINSGNFFSNGFPTGDSTDWRNITIHSATFPFDFVGGGQAIYDGFNTFSSNGGPIARSNFPLTPTNTGAGTGWIWSGVYQDIVSPAVSGSSGLKYLWARQFYIELENGSSAGVMPSFRFGCLTICDWNINPNGGGVAFVTGAYNHFSTGAMPNQSNGLPIIDYGYGTVFDHFSGTGNGKKSNTYGLGTYLKWGFGGYAQATAQIGNQGGIGPYQATGLGTEAPTFGQTAHAFEVGNDTTAEISADSAMIWPYEYNLSSSFETNPMAGLTHDDTAPVTYSYASCNVTTGGGCLSYNFNGGSRKYIGLGQDIAPEKFIGHFSFKTPGGGNSFTWELQAISPGFGSCTTSTVYMTTITTSGTGWLQGTTGNTPIDLSGSSGCILQSVLTNASSNAVVENSYIILTPWWNQTFTNIANIGSLFLPNLSGSPGDCLVVASLGAINAVPCSGSSGGLTNFGVVLGAGTGNPLTATAACTSGILLGGSPPTCGPITQALLPATSGVTLCSGTYTLFPSGTTLNAGTGTTPVTFSCPGLDSTTACSGQCYDSVDVNFYGTLPLPSGSGFATGSSGILTIKKSGTLNTIYLEVDNLTANPIVITTPTAITYQGKR
jgi:hypothetical protein